MTREAEFVIFQCENPKCRFRCPTNLTAKSLDYCPLCASPMHAVTPVFSNHKAPQIEQRSNLHSLQVLLDNLRSTLNVGSIFRSADGAGVNKIHLCGTTPTPEHPKIAKTGLGAEWNLPWEYHRNGLDFVHQSHQAGFKVLSLEATATAKPIYSWAAGIKLLPHSILLVMGNEVSGIDPDILAESDAVYSIPMSGVKTSLNVAVAFGIAVYTIQESFSQVE